MAHAARPSLQVLVAEDDDSIRELIADVLRLEGYVVAEARDGLEALRWLRQHPAPCLLVLDLMMPRLDGLELLAELAQHRPDLLARTVVASASPDLLRSLPRTLAAVLPKPFGFEDLLAAVRAADSRS